MVTGSGLLLSQPTATFAILASDRRVDLLAGEVGPVPLIREASLAALGCHCSTISTRISALVVRDVSARIADPSLLARLQPAAGKLFRRHLKTYTMPRCA
jgi:hypothetical protein